jgi:hypothetical protein
MGSKVNLEKMDEDNLEWAEEMFARSIRLKDLPESPQRTLSQGKRKQESAPIDGEAVLLRE